MAGDLIVACPCSLATVPDPTPGLNKLLLKAFCNAQLRHLASRLIAVYQFAP